MAQSLSMANSVETCRWKEIGTADRALRVAMFIGVAGFAAFWLISLWLEGAASRQPGVATAVYQFPYHHKGHTNYLTASQAWLASWGNILAYGWGLGAAAGCLALLSERRAARIRVDTFLRRHDPRAENSDS